MTKILIWSFLIFIMLISPFIGAVDLKLADILDTGSLSAQIFYDLRLPRVIYAFFAGSILAVTGLLFQTLFRNPLMTPYTLGISSGATLGTGIAIKLGLSTVIFGIAAVSFFGFLGAMLTIFLLIYLSHFLRNSEQTSLLLLGIALSLFYTAALMVVFYLGSAIQNDMLIRFTMGSLSIIGWNNPLVLAVLGFIITAVTYAYRFELQLLGVSDESAKLKGVESKKITLLLLSISSISIGVLVSISGPIGFIGLIVPHIVTKLYPTTIQNRIITTSLFGGFFLLLCDTISRTIQTQSELPIGIITALIGGPFFIYLIISRVK